LILEPLVELHGHKPVALLQRRYIKQWRDARGETPGMANMIVKVMRLVLSYAVENEYRRDNPAQRIKLFTLGEHRAWTDEECAAFEARWRSGTMQRRAYMLAKYTGQRCSDLARMTRAHRKGGEIRVEQQQKTGTPLWIFEHRDLAAELALNGGDHFSLLTSPKGQAFDADSLGRWFADAIDGLGCPMIVSCTGYARRQRACWPKPDAMSFGSWRLRATNRFLSYFAIPRTPSSAHWEKPPFCSWRSTKPEPRLPNLLGRRVPNGSQGVDATMKSAPQKLTFR
jgi:hypothetical protein